MAEYVNLPLYVWRDTCQRRVAVASELISGHIIALGFFLPNVPFHLQGKHGRLSEQIPRERTGQILRR